MVEALAAQGAAEEKTLESTNRAFVDGLEGWRRG
jgi:hypothetical protein